jgi:hypothetical protein
MQVMSKEYKALLDRNKAIAAKVTAGKIAFNEGQTIRMNPHQRAEYGWVYWQKGYKDAEQAAAQAAMDSAQ